MNSNDLFLLFLLLPLAAAQNPNLDTLGRSDEYARFNPSMAIIVVIFVAAFFFMAFFSVYLRTCNADGIPPIAVQTSRRAAASRGLESSVIQTFPTFTYSDVMGLKIGKGALECAVCLSEFEGDETLRLIPKCDHVFHPDCIDAWLASHTTCPVCRADLAPEKSADLNLQSDVDPEDVITNLSGMLNRNRTREGARKFPRSHSTGHSSLVQPGDDTERFTLRLPVEVRKQLVENRALNRATSMVVLPREWSSRRMMSYRRLESLGQVVKSDRWVFTMAPPFLVRASESVGTSARRKASFIARVLSLKAAGQPQAAEEVGTSTRPPV